MVDLSSMIDPTSDQLDAVDLLGGPRTFTIEAVSEGNSEQPVNIKLAEFDRPWRPGKSMRRVLVAIWGGDGKQYVGKRITLFCDPNVRFGGAAVGGTRISHMSGISEKRSVPLLVSRGKSAVYVVEPLTEPEAPTRAEWESRISGSTDVAELRQWWQLADPAARNLIEVRVATLQAEAQA